MFTQSIPMPRFKSCNFYQNRPKIKLILQNIFERWGPAPRPPKCPLLLRIFAHVQNAKHPIRLMLSDAEPQFQKLLK